MSTRCRKTTRRCPANSKCYRKKTWRKRTPKAKCPKGTRKCRDNKCYKKISFSP